MTEAEWLASTDIYKMLEYLRGKVSDRKLRLFAVACCYRPYYFIPDERQRRAILLAERMADEWVDENEWREAHQAVYDLWQTVCAMSLATQSKAPRGTPEVEKMMDADMATAAGWAILEDAWEAAYQVTGVEWDEAHIDEPDQQLALLRDIFGNPLRTIAIAPASLRRNDALLVSLAQRFYAARDFRDMPILADALDEAGCTDADILNHCRLPGEHVRGCWVVDSILGKS